MGPNELSLTLFTDGVEVFKSLNKNMWPLFLAINELDPRKSFIRPAAVYYGTGKPNGNHLLQCVKKSLLKLGSEGLKWINPDEPGKVNITKVL